MDQPDRTGPDHELDQPVRVRTIVLGTGLDHGFQTMTGQTGPGWTVDRVGPWTGRIWTGPDRFNLNTILNIIL